MVSHQANSLVRVWSYYKNTSRYLRVGEVQRSYCKKEWKSKGATLIHIWTRHNMYSGTNRSQVKVEDSTKEGCTIPSLSFGQASR